MYKVVSFVLGIAVGYMMLVCGVIDTPNSPDGDLPYNPPVPSPEIDRDFNSVRQMVDTGMPVLINFLWSENGMAVLDDYGYLNVEVEDLQASRDFVRVACVAFYQDMASEQNVFNCGPFYGRWIPENGTDADWASFDNGNIRSFMITETDMETLFKHGAWAIR